MWNCPFIGVSRELLTPQQHYDWGLRALKTVLKACGGLLQQQRRSHEKDKSKTLWLFFFILRYNIYVRLFFSFSMERDRKVWGKCMLLGHYQNFLYRGDTEGWTAGFHWLKYAAICQDLQEGDSVKGNHSLTHIGILKTIHAVILGKFKKLKLWLIELQLGWSSEPKTLNKNTMSLLSSNYSTQFLHVNCHCWHLHQVGLIHLQYSGWEVIRAW